MAEKNLLLRLLPKGKFARSVSVLAGGTAAGQGIVVLFSPLLTRLYSPEDFGVLAVFASLLGILGVIASLRYHLAIPLPESDKEAANVTVLSLVVVLGMAVLTAAIATPLRHSIADAFNTPLLANYIWLLPLGLLLMGIYQVFNYWAIRVKAFPTIAKTKLTQSVSMVAFQVIGSALGPLALLLGRVLGQATGVTKLGSLAFTHGRDAFRFIDLSGIRRASVRYYSFPLYSSWAGLLNAGGTLAPPILFSIFFGTSAAGLYLLAHRVIALPMTLLGSAIADVFMPNAVEALRKARLSESVASLQKQLARIALPPAVLLFVAAPEVFQVAFGPDWEQAGHMVRWLTPMLFLQFLISPLSRIFMALERQRLEMFLQANLFLLRLGSLVVAGYLAIDLLDAVIWYGIASGIGYLAYGLGISLVSGNSLSGIIKSCASCFPWLLLVSAPLLMVSYMEEPGALWVDHLAMLASLVLLFFYYRLAFDWG